MSKQSEQVSKTVEEEAELEWPDTLPIPLKSINDDGGRSKRSSRAL